MALISPKQYGLDVEDLELEVRLRRIETILARKTDANFDAATTSPRVSTVPQVTGLSKIGQNPGTVTVGWNAVTIPDLRRYELRFAENLAFTSNVQNINTASTQYQLSTVSTTGGSTNTTLYVKVRAVNSAGLSGNWSVVLNTSTGQVLTDDIADNAVSGDILDPPASTLATVTKAQGLANIVATIIANEGLKGEMSGLITSKASNTSITVTAGSCSRLTQHLANAITKTTAASWTAGTGEGGLSNGAVAANTWYNIFLIRKSSDGSVDAGFDTDVTATNLLFASGYDQYRLLGAFLTDASSNIYPYYQDHETFRWGQCIDHTVITTVPVRSGFPATQLTLSFVPNGHRVQAVVHAEAWAATSDGGVIGIYFVDLSQEQSANTITPSANTAYIGNGMVQLLGGLVTVAGSGISWCAGEALVMTSTAQKIAANGGTNDMTADDNIDQFALRVHGWNWLGLRGAVVADS